MCWMATARQLSAPALASCKHASPGQSQSWLQELSLVAIISSTDTVEANSALAFQSELTLQQFISARAHAAAATLIVFIWEAGPK